MSVRATLICNCIHIDTSLTVQLSQKVRCDIVMDESLVYFLHSAVVYLRSA